MPYNNKLAMNDGPMIKNYSPISSKGGAKKKKNRKLKTRKNKTNKSRSKKYY